MAPGRKRVPTPAAGVQPPPSGARGDGENANPGTGGALQMGCAVGGHHPMRRPRPDEFSEEHLTDYERVRAQTEGFLKQISHPFGKQEPNQNADSSSGFFCTGRSSQTVTWRKEAGRMNPNAVYAI